MTELAEYVTNCDEHLYAGVELGGTKCICTLASGPEHIVEQVTCSTKGAEETLLWIEKVLSGWWQHYQFAGLGIASFGPIDLNPHSPGFGKVLATNKKGWEGADVVGRLSRPFDVPMLFDTDVNGAALAEIMWGAGQGCENFAYITVGTGVGVGHVVHGRPTRGLLGHSELGHMLVPRLAGDQWPSACAFHDNCVEGLASGSAIQSRVGAAGLDSILPDDPIWDVVSSGLVHLCHALVCATGPARIVMGGGVIDRQPHLLERLNVMLRESLGGYIILPSGQPYITRPGLGDQAGPLGPIAMARSAASVLV